MIFTETSVPPLLRFSWRMSLDVHHSFSRYSRRTAWESANRCTRSELGRNNRSTRGKEPSDQSMHEAVPVHRQQRHVSGPSRPLRHPLRRQRVGGGYVESIESTHESNKASTPLPRSGIDFNITYKREGFKLTAFVDTNWHNNPANGESMSSHLVMT